MIKNKSNTSPGSKYNKNFAFEKSYDLDDQPSWNDNLDNVKRKNIVNQSIATEKHWADQEDWRDDP